MLLLCRNVINLFLRPASFSANLDLNADTKNAKYCKSVNETSKGYSEINPVGTACQTIAS